MCSQIQSFASHQLNRDTWRDDTLQTIVKGSFIFWQVSPSSAAQSTDNAFAYGSTRKSMCNVLGLPTYFPAPVCTYICVSYLDSLVSRRASLVVDRNQLQSALGGAGV